MAKRLKLFLFTLQLGINLVWLVISLAWFKVSYTAKLLSSFSFLTLFITVLIIHNLPVQSATEVVFTTPPPHPELLSVQQLSKTELLQEKHTLEQLYSLQPHHRDVLVNLALVEQALGNTEQFDLYWNKARSIDPNNDLFSN